MVVEIIALICDITFKSRLVLGVLQKTKPSMVVLKPKPLQAYKKKLCKSKEKGS